MPNVSSLKYSSSAGVSSSKNYVHFSDKLTGTLQDITKAIEENKEIIDTVQELGIDLSRTIASLSVTAIKYVKMVDSVLDLVVPVITGIPLIPKKTTDSLNNLRSLVDKIVASCEKSQQISADVEKGLVSGDVTKLKSHSADLKNVTASIRGILPDK
jgi:methyl-accepting chemotaxis protein